MSKRHDCPCDSGRALAECCGPIIDGSDQAETAQALMRSRYSAYVLRNIDHLRRSWHPTTRPHDLDLGDPVNWLGLKILSIRDGNTHDRNGLVEFVARYKVAGRGYRLHEISRFECLDDRWYYLSGEPGPSDSRDQAASR
ncbi:MAG: YchJ family metal-binding protein [Thiohalocapsa sp.]